MGIVGSHRHVLKCYERGNKRFGDWTYNIDTGTPYLFRQLERCLSWDETTYRSTFPHMSLCDSILR